MKVQLDGGQVIDLGTTETTPTIGITDYSRRVTDDFGVTTVVERGFSRRMSVRLALPFDAVDGVQRQLANLRATSALWIADASLQWLNVVGFYKDFDLDLAVPPLSFCTLTVEGLAETEVVADGGGDPAPIGSASTLRLLQPIDVDDAQLFASSVPENDAAAWAAGTTYAIGARVIRAHRVWESVVGSNVGNDPVATVGSWLNAGPTNRWAMFDQALGTATSGTGSISATLAPAASIGAVAFLDAIGATARVQVTSGGSTIYDQSAAVNGRGVVTFTGLPQVNGARVIATLTGASGSAPVALGTLLAGAIVALGITEASPTAGIIDYSRKEVDDFGAVTIVQRAWAKRMTTQALIRTDAVDLVANRIAAVRARPALWIGDSALDSLAVYGFFKDFSIEVGDVVSKLSLSIEGLSTAAAVGTGLSQPVPWPSITDPTGTKPTDNADKTGDNTSKDTNAVGGRPAGEVTSALDTLVTVTIPAVQAAGAAAGQRITEARAAADLALETIESEVERVDLRIDNLSASGGYDDTAVNARITDERELSLGRDAALGTRIDTVSASVTTTDTSLRALVQTKEQAAVDRENAISQRVDQLVAEGGGGSDGVDTVARAEISRVETAAVSRDQALAGRIAVTEASSVVGGEALNANASFAVWPESDPYPSRWNGWGDVGPVNRLANSLGGGGFMVEHSPAGINSGLLVPNVFLTRGWYVMEADVWLTSGSWNGAGMTLHGEYSLDFMAEKDVAEDIGDTSSGGVRRFRKLFQIPAGGEGYKNVHLMSNWDSFGRGYTAKTVRWLRCGVRPATDAEIASRKVEAANVIARVTAAETALADGRFATAQRAANIEAAVGAVGGRVSAVETVTSNGTFATAARAEQIASYAGGVEAKVDLQAGTIAGLGQKTAAYVRVIADAGGGRAALSLWSDQYGGAWSLTGDGLIDGNLTVNGTITTAKVAPNAITAVGLSQSASRSIPYSSSFNSPATGLGFTAASPAGGALRVDFATTAITSFGYIPPGSAYPPNLFFSLWRTQGGNTVQLTQWEQGTTGSFNRNNVCVDTPAAGTPATYFIRYAFDETSGSGSYTMGAEVVIATELKR